MLTVRCDECTLEGPSSPGGLAAERQAQVEGWVVTSERRHLCPHHAHLGAGFGRHHNRPGPELFDNQEDYQRWIDAIQTEETK